MGFQKRLSQGFTILANYTLSHALQSLPIGVTGPGPNAPGTVFPWYFAKANALDYGDTDFDHRQRFVISYVWQLPTPSAGKVVRAALGDWQLTGVFQAQTGGEFTVTAGKDQSQTGLGGDRGVLVGPALGPGACTSAPCVNYLVPSSFAQPPAATVASPYLNSFGNIGAGAILGPGMMSWDVGVFRSIRFHERNSLQLRGEFFNVLNHSNFSNPTSGMSSGGFGSISSAGDPRIGQLALKLIF
jgi:hypothetical protein